MYSYADQSDCLISLAEHTRSCVYMYPMKIISQYWRLVSTINRYNYISWSCTICFLQIGLQILLCNIICDPICKKQHFCYYTIHTGSHWNLVSKKTLSNLIGLCIIWWNDEGGLKISVFGHKYIVGKYPFLQIFIYNDNNYYYI